MLRLSFRIYLAANLLLFFFFALFAFPDGVWFGLVALFFGAMFSAPAIVLLSGCFTLVRRWRTGLAASWLLLAMGIVACAFVPILLISLFEGSFFGDREFLLLAFACAFGGLLCQALPVHRYFKNLLHETEFATEND